MAAERFSPSHLVIGQILRPHGIRGELKVKVLTDYPERIGKLDRVYLGKDPQGAKAEPYTVQSARPNKDFVLLSLKEIHDRTQADGLRSLYVMVDIDHAIPLDENEYYLYELIGLQVVSQEGNVLGTIQDVIETGANDVYVLSSPQYGEILFPAHTETIIQQDFEQGIITVTIPDGLLPDP